MIGITKYGLQVQILSEEEIKNKKVTKYLRIVDWSPIGDTLKLQLFYAFEGLMINYMFVKENSEWNITKSLSVEH